MPPPARPFGRPVAMGPDGPYYTKARDETVRSLGRSAIRAFRRGPMGGALLPGGHLPNPRVARSPNPPNSRASELPDSRIFERRTGHEADFSTQHPPSQEDARFPSSDAHARGPAGPQAASAEGPMAPDAVNRRETWPPDLRLRRRRDYQRVFQEGRTEATPYFILRWRPNDRGVPRLGLQIGRRAASRAVVRNRWKRWAREVFRRHRHGWPAVDIVLVARPEMKDLSFQSFQAAFLAAVRRIVRRWERLRSGRDSA